MKTWGWLGAVLLTAPVLAGDLFEHPQTPAQAETALRAAMPGLGQMQVLRGRFSQRKFLREIPRPLTSTGEFLLVRDRGIWWHTQTPLESELTLTPGGAAQQQLAASIFFALFALDLDTLARNFDLFVMDSGEPKPQWLLGLQPRDATLAAWFQQATISGGLHVQRITLFEAAGDRTEIDLDAATQPRSSLTPAERKRFEL